MAGKKRQAKDVVPEEEGESDLDSSSSGEDDDYPEVSDQDPASDEDDEDNEAGPSNNTNGELINVDFEFFDPTEGDYHGIKVLLNGLLDGQPFATAPLADFILQQKEVGTVIKTGPEEEVLGMATIIPAAAAPSLGGAIQELAAFVKAHAPTDEDRARVDAALVDHAQDTGILLHTRLLNCPYQLGPPLQKILFDELQGALDQPFSEESKAMYSFTQLFILDRVYAEPATVEKSQLKKQQKRRAVANTEELVYVFPETQFYHKHCRWSYSFAAPNKSVSKDSLEPRRLVMVLSVQDAARARAEMDAALGNAAAAP